MLPIPKVFDKSSSKEKNSLYDEYFLSLVIDNKSVKAGIWRFSGQIGELLSSGSKENWEGESPEDLVVAADVSIASAISKLPEISGKQPTKVLLGLPQSWLENNNLKSTKAKILQSICKKLLIFPLGFVVTPEAVSHFLKKEEGGLPNVILVSIEETEINVSLVIQGKYLGSQEVDRSDNLPLDLKEGLQRFAYGGNLPSRILLIGGNKLEESRQRLIAYPWVNSSDEEKLSFLQLPKIDISEEELIINAVIYGGSQDINKNNLSVNERNEVEEKKEDVKIIIETPEVIKVETNDFFPKEDFGFIEGEDIVDIEEKIQEPVEINTEIEQEIIPYGDNFTVIDSNQPSKKQKNLFPTGFFKKFAIFKKTNKLINETTNFENKDVDYRENRKKRWTPFSLIGKILINRFTIFLFIVFIVLGSSLGFAFWKLVKAEVRLMIKPFLLEKEFDFTVSSQASLVDLQKSLLPSLEGKIDISSEKTVEVKGKKVVGEKATGEVTIYNQSNKIKSLLKGTKIKGRNNLNFILTENISIASQSSEFTGEDFVYKSGKTKVRVEAMDIGPQYNMSVNADLVIEGSDLLVKNLTSFSGGTSREIQAVSKEDKDNLQKSLTNELINKAREEIASSLSPQNHLLESSLQIKSKILRFDHEINDEVPSLSLETKAVVSYLYFRKSDLDSLIEKNISSLLLGDLQKNPVENSNSITIKDKNKNLYSVLIKRTYYPIINNEEISQNLRAKNYIRAKDYLRNISSVSGYEVKISPQIFTKFQYFPLRKENINIVIEPI